MRDRFERKRSAVRRTWLGEPAVGGEALFPLEPVRMGDGMVTKFVESYLVRSAGPRARARKLGGRKNEGR